MAASDGSQGTLFWDRLRPLFSPGEDERRPGDDPRRGLAIAVSVFLSFILWLSLTLDETRTQTLRLPVEVVEKPAEQALAEVPPSAVRVQVQGSGLELIRLLYNPPVVEVEGTTSRVNVREEINLPTGVQIESVTPSSFGIKLEPLQARKVPIQSRVQIGLASAYELIDEPQLRPDSVQIEGAQSIVEQIRTWPTDSITIDNLQDTVEVQVPLADTLNRLVRTGVNEVTLVARAGRFAVKTREVEVQVTGVPSGQDLVALQPSSIRIRYRVLFEQLFQARRSSEFFATVSYDQIRSDTTGYVEPRVHVPSDLLIRDPEPIPARLRYYTYLSGE